MLAGMSGATVTEGDRPGSRVVWVDGVRQSEVDLTDPTRLGFDYARRIADVVDLVGEPGAPLRVVHVGGAGMMLARYVAATRPRSSQVVLEPDADLVELVRRELPLPPRSGIKVRVVDGRRGVPALREASVDVMVLDAFAGAATPLELLTVEWWADVARALGPAGLLVANLADAAPFPLVRRAVAGMRPALGGLFAGAEPATLKARRPGNVLLVAGPDLPLEGFRARAARHGMPYRVFDGRAVSDSFGGGRALSDAEADVAVALE